MSRNAISLRNKANRVEATISDKLISKLRLGVFTTNAILYYDAAGSQPNNGELIFDPLPEQLLASQQSAHQVIEALPAIKRT